MCLELKEFKEEALHTVRIIQTLGLIVFIFGLPVLEELVT